ncbi:MAG: hypothetical protein ACFB11_18975 [Paracoccaceae bacterium]
MAMIAAEVVDLIDHLLGQSTVVNGFGLQTLFFAAFDLGQVFGVVAHDLGPNPAFRRHACGKRAIWYAAVYISPFRRKLLRCDILQGAQRYVCGSNEETLVLSDKETTTERGDVFVLPSWVKWAFGTENQLGLFRFSDAPRLALLHMTKAKRGYAVDMGVCHANVLSNLRILQHRFALAADETAIRNVPFSMSRTRSRASFSWRTFEEKL